jgi:hypothetical protein
MDNFAGASVLAFSAVGYSLMATSYYLHARRIRAVSWFAPLWWLAHLPAAILTLGRIRRAADAHSKEVAVKGGPSSVESRNPKNL